MFLEHKIGTRMISEGSCDTEDWSNDEHYSLGEQMRFGPNYFSKEEILLKFPTVLLSLSYQIMRYEFYLFY